LILLTFTPDEGKGIFKRKCTAMSIRGRYENEGQNVY